MLNKDSHLLEEAYLSISKKTPGAQADEQTPSTDPNATVSVGSMDDPAPGVDMNMIDSQVQDVAPEDKDTTGVPVSMEGPSSAEDPRLDIGDESEEDSMTIDNLNSIRESIMKIASRCATGFHLEPWAQQKLAIAMDNLAEVARRMH